MIEVNRIIQGDCVDIMNTLPSESIDLVFADPPYNLQLRHGVKRPETGELIATVTDEWDHFESNEDYDTFTREWLTACKRLMKDTSSLWVTGTYHNIYRIGAILADLGFYTLNEIVWEKANPMPNMLGTRFCAAHETLIWVKRDKKSKYTFNYEDMKEVNGGLQMRSVWRFPICQGNARIKDDDGDTLHPTQKPESLLYRVISSSTSPGDVVLDPFFGTGTTGAVAKKLNRHWIGIEREQRYIDAAQKRISRAQVPMF